MVYIQTDKLNALLHSRKFWALITALVVDLFGVLDRVATPEIGILAALGTISAYMVSTAVEDAGAAHIVAAQIAADAANPQPIVVPPVVPPAA